MGRYIRPQSIQNKVILTAITTLLLTFLLIRKFMKVSFTGDKDTPRGCDPMGCGHFGAPRSNNRNHKGFDILLDWQHRVNAPFNCKIKRFGKAYSSTSEFDLVVIQGLGLLSFIEFKIIYIDSVKAWNVGDILNRGDWLGSAQNIARYHGNNMKNHIHVELYIMGKLVNPEKFIKT